MNRRPRLFPTPGDRFGMRASAMLCARSSGPMSAVRVPGPLPGPRVVDVSHEQGSNSTSSHTSCTSKCFRQPSQQPSAHYTLNITLGPLPVGEALDVSPDGQQILTASWKANDALQVGSLLERVLDIMWIDSMTFPELAIWPNSIGQLDSTERKLASASKRYRMAVHQATR